LLKKKKLVIGALDMIHLQKVGRLLKNFYIMLLDCKLKPFYAGWLNNIPKNIIKSI